MGAGAMPTVLGDKNDPRTSRALPRALIAYAIVWVVALIVVFIGILAFH